MIIQHRSTGIYRYAKGDVKTVKTVKTCRKTNQPNKKKKTLYKVFASSFDYSPLILALM